MVEEKQEGGVFYPPPPGKIRLRDMREIQPTLQQYRDVTTILAMIICK